MTDTVTDQRFKAEIRKEIDDLKKHLTEFQLSVHNYQIASLAWQNSVTAQLNGLEKAVLALSNGHGS